MKATYNLQKMEIKLGQLAVLDYRAVVLPLVKSLLQVPVQEFDADTYISPEIYALFLLTYIWVVLFFCIGRSLDLGLYTRWIAQL